MQGALPVAKYEEYWQSPPPLNGCVYITAHLCRIPHGRRVSLFSHPLQLLTMATKSQRKKSPDGVLLKLDVAIQLLSSARDVCGFAPAQIALGSACVLLTAIKVLYFLFFDKLPVNDYSGHHRQQTGFCRPRIVLR